MHHEKFQPTMPSLSGEEVDFNGFAIFHISDHLGFSTTLNFIILKSGHAASEN